MNWSKNCSMTLHLCAHTGEVLHQGCPEVYGTRSTAQVQLHQQEVCVH